MEDWQRFSDIAETGRPEQIFGALETMVMARVGAIIFSCSTFDLTAGQSRRIYTNMPEVYPVSGLKEIIPNTWTRQVLDNRTTFVANTLHAISKVFPDHLLIGSLGCGSVINMPVFLAGHFMGTVNILHAPGYYTAERVEALHDIRPAAMVAFAAQAMTAVEEPTAQPA